MLRAGLEIMVWWISQNVSDFIYFYFFWISQCKLKLFQFGVKVVNCVSIAEWHENLCPKHPKNVPRKDYPVKSFNHDQNF